MNTSALFRAFQRMRLILPLIFFFFFATASASFAEDHSVSYQRCYQERVTIHSSSAEIPTPIIKPKTIVPLGCERPFIYRGETYSADSPEAKDASNLREFVKSVPEAEEMLKEYQSNRNKSKLSAYTGTVGILLALLAGPISKQFNGPSRDSIRSALQIGGIALAAGGFFYSFTLLRTNEYLIPKAVDRYNQSKPEDPIELKFSTGWTF
jgi:hypothetical protein